MRKFLHENKDFFQLFFWGAVLLVVFLVLMKACGTSPSAFDNDTHP